ncbi:MAG TPA: histidine kinase [Anaerolineae bacterium]|nr:histidine kinase [Caldilineae bacterium]HID35195.1 histidine kinase [Anaerolineae bacterium]HIQ12479.1 histidine kinase [Caldilineales bacterium]
MNLGLISFVALIYIGALFAIAYYGDREAERGRSLINTPYIYALSLTVYCTAWTFYGSVGRAATSGVDFLPIYLGPTIMAALWWFVLRKIIRISKIQHITSIADFIASRYGKSALLGGLVTAMAVLGVIPYISLQLKAVSYSFTLLWHYPNLALPDLDAIPILRDTGFYVALIMAAFAILFGTRHLDATEHHEGLVLAMAFESIVKLLTFLSVGVFVTFTLFRGTGDLFARAAMQPDLRRLFAFDQTPLAYQNWFWLILLSMFATLLLPRQFQMAVVENVNERHIETATWLFPFYLFVINLFVVPIALAGRLLVAGDVSPDMYVLLLPLERSANWLALLAFVGGISAATGMIIVETVALSTMLTNDLMMPLLLHANAFSASRDLSSFMLNLRRGAILLVVFLGYLFFRLTGKTFSMVSIGLISFAAVVQFAPALLGGIYWKGGTRRGALLGLLSGFLVWAYTLPLPLLAQTAGLGDAFIEAGPWGVSWLRPYALFGLTGYEPITHALFWSLLVNASLYLIGSLWSGESALEHRQAALFVDIFRHVGGSEQVQIWRGEASPLDLQTLMQRFLGRSRAEQLLSEYARTRGVTDWRALETDADMIEEVERQLAGVVGAASARVAVASIVTEEPLDITKVIHMLDETSQVVAYSRQLEQKSRELEAATAELREANRRLQELDRLKDEFISTVTHELRTPLTSIRALTEILYYNPDLPAAQRQQFLDIITKEIARLSRLINDVLDFAKLESKAYDWNLKPVNLKMLISDAFDATRQLFLERNITVRMELPDDAPDALTDNDLLMQVILNLLSNAAKFTTDQVTVRLRQEGDFLRVDVIDNGPGVDPAYRETIFEKFSQVPPPDGIRRQGTGLGLPISRAIITQLGGRIWVEGKPGQGATFSFTLPISPFKPSQETSHATT